MSSFFPEGKIENLQRTDGPTRSIPPSFLCYLQTKHPKVRISNSTHVLSRFICDVVGHHKFPKNHEGVKIPKLRLQNVPRALRAPRVPRVPRAPKTPKEC